jgi:hypothetical protein
MRHFLALAIVFVSCACSAGCGSAGSSPTPDGAPAAVATDLANVLVEDLQGNQIPAVSGGSGKAFVFLFVRTDCPISNRYVPEIQRLSEKFAARGIQFRLV